MRELYITGAVLILMTLIAGLWRLFVGPTRADRMLAAQLGGTAGVAIFALSAFAWAQPFLLDLAVVFAILAAVSTIAFVRLTWQKPVNDKEGPHVFD